MSVVALSPTRTLSFVTAGPCAGGETGLTGATLGHIRIGEPIGQGGMGTVFAGFDEKLERRVAIKAIRSGHFDSGARARFLREARTLSQLRHPHICQIHEYVEDGGRDFIVLELIDGRDLDDVIAAGLSAGLRWRIAEQVVGALVAAHGQGIVHRDLKPRNVMLTREGDVKVLDFGIARSGPAGDEDAGVVVGTLAYMSPEQARGEPVSTASDVYSCGLLLQEIFSGRSACEPGVAAVEQLARARAGVTPAPDGIGAGLSALILRMKEQAPGARPSAVDVLERLRFLRDAPRRQRRRLGLAAGFAAMALLAAGMTVEARRAAREAGRANQEAEAARQVSDLLVGLFEVGDAAEGRGDTVTARELLDRGAAKMERELRDQSPLVRARMTHAVGAVYQELALYDDSRRMHEKALAIRLEELGRDHVDVAESLEELGSVHLLSGDTGRAEELIREAMAIRERSGAAPDADLAALWFDLGEVHEARGEPGPALSCYAQALAMQERILAPDHPSIGESAYKLGRAYSRIGDPVRAEPLLSRARQVLERQGAADPDAKQMLASARLALDELRTEPAGEILEPDEP